MSAAAAKGTEHLKPNKGTNEIGTDPFSEFIIVNVERKLSLRGAKRRACTPKWRYGTQAWQSHEPIVEIHNLTR